MSDIRHHPKDLTLAAYAAGQLDEARSVVIAAHLRLCAKCRLAVADFEAVGGACLETVEPAAMSDSALDSFWLRAGKQEAAPAPASILAANDFALDAAHPLARYLKEGVDAIAWKNVAPGLAQHVIPADGYRPGVLRLLKISPGVRIPKHTHGDEELTLILRGSYTDEVGEFRHGDLADLDEDVLHAPLATGDQPCICLIATSAPLRFRSIVGRIVQPFIGL
ncbi:MAG TPA: transcriptional regulator [Parvularcula sp.]|nr:transcriptional regulator [Parvularcula sp.]HBS34877.1 transcriptional regulator [Parvularcula sp.]